MATYSVDLPSDYLHMLNCICVYNVKKTFKCYNCGDTWRAAATRLTADAYSQVLDDFWLKPSYKRPYYYIHSIGNRVEYYDINDIPQNETQPANPNEGDTYHTYEASSQFTRNGEFIIHTYQYTRIKNTGDNNGLIDPGSEIIDPGSEIIPRENPGYQWVESISQDHVNLKYYDSEPQVSSSQQTDYHNNVIAQSEGNPTSINIKGNNYSNVERGSSIRYGNPSIVKMEIRYGTDDTIFSLRPEAGLKGGKVIIDYLKVPQTIRLTQQEIDMTEDTSKMLEFPDYICQEILNELTNIMMEHIRDPRLQTFPVVSQSIAAQQQAPDAAAGQTAQQQ